MNMNCRLGSRRKLDKYSNEHIRLSVRQNLSGKYPETQLDGLAGDTSRVRRLRHGGL
jgi:hypothetical protein